MNYKDQPLTLNSGTSLEAHEVPDYQSIETRLNDEFSLDRWFYNPEDGAFYSYTPIGAFLSELGPCHWAEEVRYYDGYESEGDIEVEGSLNEAIAEVVSQLTFSSFNGHTLIHANISVETNEALVYLPLTPLQDHDYWKPYVTHDSEIAETLTHLNSLGQHGPSQQQAFDFLDSLLDTSENPHILPVAEYLTTVLLTPAELGIDNPTEEKLFTWLTNAAEGVPQRPTKIFAALLSNQETQGPMEQKIRAMAAWTPMEYEGALIEAIETITPYGSIEREEFYAQLPQWVSERFSLAVANFISAAQK